MAKKYTERTRSSVATGSPVRETRLPRRCEPPRPSKPPPPRQESWADILQSCQDGLWWLVRRYDQRRTAVTIASHLRVGVKATPPGNWEFRAGRTEDGRYGVWARRSDVFSNHKRMKSLRTETTG